MNYKLNEIDKPLPELLSMLRTTKQNLQKTKHETIMMVQKGKGKGNGKKKKDSKSNGKPKPKPKNVALNPKAEWLRKANASTTVRSNIRRETTRFMISKIFSYLFSLI